KSAVAERTEILNAFASCTDSQRAWLLLEDYFEKLSLARKDFAGSAWWPQLLDSHGQDRLEATALLFLTSQRPIPHALLPYANFEKFAQLEQAEQEQAHLRLLENWILPPEQFHIDSPRAALRIVCEVAGDEDEPGLRCLKVGVGLSRPRTGEKLKTF